MVTRKIAYLTPLFFDNRSCIGGGERYPTNLARGVVAASGGAYNVELISFGPARHRQLLADGVTLRVLETHGRGTNALDVLSWDLPEAVADAELVHIHQAYTRCSEVGLLVAKHQRKPICITDHGGFTSGLGVEVGAIDLADHVIPYSDFGASFYKTRAPITVVKGGVDAGHFTPPDSPVPRDRVLYVGRLLPHKGIDRLIRALPPELPLTVCGRPYHESYFRKLRELSAGKQVEFVTDADDATIRDLYHRAWATVLPSVYRDCYGTVQQIPELMGLTLLESMASGTPAIANRVGAMPEFIDQGETGFVYDDPDELTRYLTLLAGDPELVDRMGLMARRAVETRFDLGVVGAKLMTIYDEVIARSGRREAAA